MGLLGVNLCFYGELTSLQVYELTKLLVLYNKAFGLTP